MANYRRDPWQRRAAAIAAMLLGSVPAFAQEGDAIRGKQLYYDHACYSCHGYNGETGARDLVGTGSPIVESLELFMTFLRARADLAPLFPTTRMPNYPQSTLSDAQARDLFTYISTFELDAPEVDDIPALRSILNSAATR